jgi:hypothetical protein
MKESISFDVKVNGSPLARGAGLARGNSHETRQTHDNATLSDFSDWRVVRRLTT